MAYVAHGIEGIGSGVRAKILSQLATWSRLRPDMEFALFVRCEAGSEADWIGQPHVRAVRSSRHGIPGRLLQRELLSLDVARWRPNLVYLRQSTVSPSIVTLAAAIPTIVELNTLDLSEHRIRSRPRYLYALITRAILLRRARAFVTVTDEIASDPSVRSISKPTLTSPNSVDLTTVRPLPPPRNDLPHAIFVGAPHLPWNGIDKIERLAQQFPEWTFDLVGPDVDELCMNLKNVHAHGLLPPEEYLPLLERADVALGPLALHRKGMNEAAPLKVGEYLAYGIPVVIAHADPRFPKGAEFLLQLPNTEANVDGSLDRIASFVSAWMGRRVSRNDVRSIDADSVERRRLRFMVETAGRSPA